MKKKLLLGIGLSAVLLGGAGYGTHYVITGSIEDVIAKLEARAPGVAIEYGRYSIDPFGLELSLHDVKYTQKIQTTEDSLTIAMDQVVYRECDLDNKMPRRCDGEAFGIRLETTNVQLKDLLQQLEAAAGAPLVLNTKSTSSYSPEARNRAASKADVEWPGVATMKMEAAISGVDLDKALTKMLEISESMNDATDEQKLQASMAMASDWMGLEIEKLAIEIDGATLFNKLASNLGQSTDQGLDLSTSEARLAWLDKLAEDGAAGPSPRLKAFVTDAAVRAFVSEPKSLGFKFAPESPLNVTAVATKIVSGADLKSLNVGLSANGQDIDVTAIMATH